LELPALGILGVLAAK